VLTKPNNLREVFMPQSSSKQSKNFDKKYISVAELAARWSVSQSAIYSAKCGSNALHPIRFGRSVRFLRSEVEALERNREAQAA
jgi:predicted DNA-binding transcriptional regulator AlpA